MDEQPKKDQPRSEEGEEEGKKDSSFYHDISRGEQEEEKGGLKEEDRQ